MAIYSKEDIRSMHRYKADEAYMVGTNASPVGAYLSYEEIVQVALEHQVDAVRSVWREDEVCDGALGRSTRATGSCRKTCTSRGSARRRA